MRSSSYAETPKTRDQRKEPLVPKTEAQRIYASSVRHNTITFGVGPAGVGKTYVAARIAAEEFLSGKIRKIYLTRPAVESGQSIGFLPGEMEEKMAPYMSAYGPGFRDGFGPQMKAMFEHGHIEIVPLNFIQGRSFDEPCIILFDEAQNATQDEMKMALTRLGEGARMVIDGDPKQCMLGLKSKSGLIDALKKISYIQHVGSVEFTNDDIVRSGIVREIINAYESRDEQDEDDQINELPDWIKGG